jgi:hypothetical protein
MATQAEIEAGARALAREYAPSTRFESWSDLAQDRFRVQAEAVLDAAERVRR